MQHCSHKSSASWEVLTWLPNGSKKFWMKAAPCSVLWLAVVLPNQSQASKWMELITVSYYNLQHSLFYKNAEDACSSIYTIKWHCKYNYQQQNNREAENNCRYTDFPEWNIRFHCLCNNIELGLGIMKPGKVFWARMFCLTIKPRESPVMCNISWVTFPQFQEQCSCKYHNIIVEQNVHFLHRFILIIYIPYNLLISLVCEALHRMATW